MAPSDFWQDALWKPVSYRDQAGKLTSPVGWMLHVVVGNGSPFATFENAVGAYQRFSHIWVAKDGHVEQYTEMSNKAWAAVAANALYWHAETEGFPNEPLTDAQVKKLAEFHNFIGAADTVTDTPGGSGIGVHYMGGAAYGNHSCPDPVSGAGPRSKQRQSIIDYAVQLRGDLPHVPPQPTIPPPSVPNGSLLTLGAKGPGVADLQAKLNNYGASLQVDGDFGPLTLQAVKNFQRSRGLLVDGVVGPLTQAALVIAAPYVNSGLVVALQRAVRVAGDGIWGPITDAALEAVRRHNTSNVFYLQQRVGTTADGIWGPNSENAYRETVKEIQHILGVGSDGVWGPITDGAYMAIRSKVRG